MALLDPVPPFGDVDARCRWLAQRFDAVRSRTVALAAPIGAEDAMVQSMADTSPTKWHLAHTTWFFERFVLGDGGRYTPFDPAWNYLFNSYYQGAGAMHDRPRRGLLSRPTLAQVSDYRDTIETRMRARLQGGELDARLLDIVELGLQHEQQHQELLLTDIKHAFFSNPLHPAYRADLPRATGSPAALNWIARAESIVETGHAAWPGDAGFAYDNESPRHRVLVPAHALASRPVSNAEFRAFIDDGGYRTAGVWLSAGWDIVRVHDWTRPLYWSVACDTEFTLGGWRALDPEAPVCHLSYYEADAFARWAGARLPTEFEWEQAAASLPVTGNFVDSGRLHPCAPVDASTGLQQMFGDVWEWTSSAYTAYPGYRPWPGTLGEYNGKFMDAQWVLRGGSCATSADHVRASYRNFFPSDARWQFAGLRLAKDSRMNAAIARARAQAALTDLRPQPDDIAADAISGLSRMPKTLPSKYFYDAEGSRLFEAITRQPEYYLTRVELALMEARMPSIAQAIGDGVHVVEFGSGSGRKTELLLEGLAAPVAYTPIEISRTALMDSVTRLGQNFPDVQMLPVCADFTRPVPLPRAGRRAHRTLVFFPGSTLGNFSDEEAVRLLRSMRGTMGDSGCALIGIDLDKDPAVIEAAYNDLAGVTAAFTVNLLTRLNREIDSDFDPDRFHHRAIYARDRMRIETMLVSERAQTVRIGDHAFDFAEGEVMHVEISQKYTDASFSALAAQAGLHVTHGWNDDGDRFGLRLLQPA